MPDDPIKPTTLAVVWGGIVTVATAAAGLLKTRASNSTRFQRQLIERVELVENRLTKEEEKTERLRIKLDLERERTNMQTDLIRRVIADNKTLANEVNTLLVDSGKKAKYTAEHWNYTAELDAIDAVGEGPIRLPRREG